jgi:1-acyl-sn-glycerol-3-phosphate acyltransferase
VKVNTGTYPTAPVPIARALYERAAFALALAVFGVGGVIYTLFGAPLYRLLPRRAAARLGQRVMTGLFRFFLGLLERLGLARVDLAALDALRGEAVVIAPNHPTLLDAVLVVSRLPNVVCVMKASILDNVFLGGGARLAGYLPSDVPREMIRRAAEALRAGQHVLVFPEGTRTVRAPVNAFKGSVAPIARLAGVPVQTVFIEARSRYLAKGWPLLRRPDFPLEFRVRLGRRFDPPAGSKAFLHELEAYFVRELGTGRP